MSVVDTATVPVTLLQAVNEMLAAVGRGPVTSTDPLAAGEEAAKAIAIISDVSIAVQSEGWWFNEEVEYALTPSPVDGTIVLPANTLSVRRSTRAYSKQQHPMADRNRTYTMRGNNGIMYLYDIANQTYSWIANTDGYTVVQPLVTGTLVVELILAFPFEDIPQPVRWYIMARAGNMWGPGRVPDMNSYKFSESVLQDAEAKARQFDQESRVTIPEDNPHFAFMRRR